MSGFTPTTVPGAGVSSAAGGVAARLALERAKAGLELQAGALLALLDELHRVLVAAGAACGAVSLGIVDHLVDDGVLASSASFAVSAQSDRTAGGPWLARNTKAEA